MIEAGITGEAMKDSVKVAEATTRIAEIVRRKVIRIHIVAILLVLVLSSSIAIVLAQQTYHFPVYPTRDYMRPLRGGLQIEVVNGTHYLNCSLGYFVRHNISYGFITAGHCIKSLWSSGNPVWILVYQPNHTSSNYLIGPNEYYLINDDIDAAFIPLNKGVNWEAYIINITGVKSYTTIAVYGYVDWDNVKSRRSCM